MSKKLSLFIFTVIPIIIGYFYNISFTPAALENLLLSNFFIYIFPIFM